MTGPCSYYNRIEKGDVVQTGESSQAQPAAISFGQHEIFWPTKEQVQAKLNIEDRYENLSAGGHFLALEQPALLADAIRKHFSSDVVKSRW